MSNVLTPKTDLEQEYLNKGYSKLPPSGAGNTVMVNVSQRKAIKINELEHDKAFADFCLNNQHLSVPFVHSHIHRSVNLSVVEMEYLTNVDTKTGEQIVSWYNEDYLGALASGQRCPTDPFGLLDTVDALVQHLRSLQQQGANIAALDMQAKNFMKAPSGRYKIIDGFC